MTPEQYAEIMRQLADVGSATARLADRLDRMEQREQHQAAIVRDIHGDSAGRLGSDPKPRRLFRPTATLSRAQG